MNFCFIDDNVVPESSLLLKRFIQQYGESIILVGDSLLASDYSRDSTTHHWTERAIWRVARYKNAILELGKKKAYDFVFLVDSDLVLHPRTLERLIEASKDIISEVFWTRWQPSSDELPQVWVSGQYDLFERDRGEQLTQEQLRERVLAFLAKLREPGVYRVGGLGACTLINRRALMAGVSFDEIYNVSFWGEDRHFCVRAAALGFELWVDTHFPACHIYREADLEGVTKFLQLTDSEDDIIRVAREVVKLYGSTEAQDQIEIRARAVLEAGLTDQLLQLHRRSQQGRKDGAFSDVSISRLEVRSVDGRNGAAQVVVWLTNRGFDGQQYFSDDLVAHIGLSYDTGTWLARSVRFIPAPTNAAEELSATTVSAGPSSRRVTSVLSQGRVRLALAMAVRNEANRYVARVLEEARHYVDAAAILDDASSDNTLDVCRRVLADIPVIVHVNSESEFHTEHILRKKLWELACSLNPEWILVLDADEMFETRARWELRRLLDATHVYYYAFRLYDFWDDEHYREDRWWSAHLVYRPLLVRFIPGFEYRWRETPQHCGRIPLNVTNLGGACSGLRVKHFGWARYEDRVRKYERYLKLDPEGKYGVREQYLTILDPTPVVVRWEEEENALTHVPHPAPWS